MKVGDLVRYDGSFSLCLEEHEHALGVVLEIEEMTAPYDTSVHIRTDFLIALMNGEEIYAGPEDLEIISEGN